MQRRIQSWLPVGFLIAGLAITVLMPRAIVGDDLVRFTVLDKLLNKGVNVPSNYSVVGPLFASPLWYLGHHLGPSAMRWCAFFNLLWFAGGLIALNALLRDAVPREVRKSFLVLLLFGSMFPNHLQHFGTEPFTALLVAIGIVLIAVHDCAWGWPLLVVATVNTPAVFGGLVLVVAVQVLRTRRLGLVVVLAATVGLFLLESWLRRGSIFASGYKNDVGYPTLMPYSGLPGFSYPFFFGLLSILFSFGKGLVYFAPGLMLPCRPMEIAPPARAAWKLCLVFLVGLVLVYSRWWAWYGGWTWGPRFFLFASFPASFTLALALHEAPRRGLAWNVLTLLVLALSFWVSYVGLVVSQQNLEMCLENNYALEHLAWHTPEFSVLWRPFVVTPFIKRTALIIGVIWLACFVHLSYPVFMRCARQLREGWADWWSLQQAKGPWRL